MEKTEWFSQFTEKIVNGISLWIHSNNLQDESKYAEVGYTFEELETLFATLNGLNYTVNSHKIIEL